MSNLRITCPRCHANLHVNRHQEQSGHLGCTHCGQLIRLAPRLNPAASLGLPMVAPSAPTGVYWNQSPRTRKQSHTALWAVAIASLGMFLTVLTVCVTFLVWQKQAGPRGNEAAVDRGAGFIPPGAEEPAAAAAIQPAVNEQAAPEVAPPPPVDLPQPDRPPAEDPLGLNRNRQAGNRAQPAAGESPPATPAPTPRKPGPFAANRPTKPPPPPLEPLPEPERPKPSTGNNVVK